jgi:hypothetical protein
MTQQSSLEVLDLEWFLEKCIFAEIQHAQTQIQTGLEVLVIFAELLFAQRLPADGRSSNAIGRNALDFDFV